MTVVATFFEQRAMSNESSPSVARVQGHLGCANRISVGRFSLSESLLCAGHTLNATFASPGLVSYRRRAIDPKQMVASQSAVKKITLPEVWESTRFAKSGNM
jgi:hypothetical protein